MSRAGQLLVGAPNSLQVTPPSVERRTPFEPNAPYQVCGAFGPAQKTVRTPLGTPVTFVHVTPASVER